MSSGPPDAGLDRADRAQARHCAARAELLAEVGALASSKTWKGRGSASLASFLAARWQISGKTARTLVREAEALTERPSVAEALASGSISVDQAEAVCKLSEDDPQAGAWVESLWGWSFPALEREARRATARRLEARDGGVYFRADHTPDERYLKGEFRLFAEDGAVVLAAVEARVPGETPLSDWDRACAEALVDLASGDGEAGRATVLVSVSERDLAADASGGAAGLAAGDEPEAQASEMVINAPAVCGSGVASITAGACDGFVGAETARRLACDSRIQALLADGTGKVVATGRTSRSVTGGLRRAVLARDEGTCTFPGCGRRRFLQCHHVRHFASGGPTVLDNLLLTCHHHHKLLHEGGWSLHGEPGPNVTWIRPDGSPHEPRVRVTLDTC